MSTHNSSNNSWASINFTNNRSVVRGVQINLRKSDVATTNLLKKCEKLKSFILFLQEPKVVKSKIKLQGAKMHYNSMVGENKPQVAIGHSNDLDIYSIPNFTDRDVCTCIWNKPELEKPIILISAYWDCLVNSIPEKLTAAISFANTKQYQFIVGIDTNAHSTTWGSPSDNVRGKLFEEFIAENNIEIHNRGNKPTFQTLRNDRLLQSIIDLTLTSNANMALINNWNISDTYEGSDHRMIYFDIKQAKQKKSMAYNFTKCNWPAFNKELDTMNWPELNIEWSPPEIDKEALLINSNLSTVLDKYCPKTPTTTRLKIKWWSNELQVMKHKVATARRLATNTRLPEHIEEYQTIQRNYKKLIRNTKRKDWTTKCSSINTQKDLAKLNRALQNQSNNNHLGMLKKADGTMTTIIEEMADVLMDTHMPNSSKTPFAQEQIETRIIAPQHNWINTTNFKRAVNLFKNNKAAGPDLIKPIVLKNLPDRVIERICTLYSACIETGYTPQIWRHAKVIFIPKPGKADYTDPNAFRPISLTSFTFKTMERLVLWHLEDTTFKLKPLHKNQHAFRRGHSTDIPLSKLTNFVEQCFISKNYAVCIFLDIIGAFNNVSHQAIIKAMKTANFPTEITNWYGNYTQGRSCEINLGNKLFKRFLKDGTSQGGILSPIIFNLIINILLLIIQKAKALGIAFADDTMAGDAGKCLEMVIGKLQRILNNMTEALDQTGMKFSPEKTAVIIFSKKNVDTSHLPKITMYNIPVEYQTQTKYLGVIFDNKLSFKPHINNKFIKAKRLLFATKSAIGKYWGPTPSMTKWLYTNVVRPTFSYGCIAWAKNTRTKEFLNKAKRLQRLALCDIGPIRTHSPTSGLEIFTNTIPLDLYIRGEFIASHNRIKNVITTIAGTSDTISSHYAWSRKLRDESGLHNIPSDTITPYFHGFKGYNCKNEQYDVYNETRNDKLQIFTDGSLMKKSNKIGHAGSGSVIYHQGQSESNIIHEMSAYLGTMTTVFQAEIFAIGQAAHYINTHQDILDKGIKEVDIITDSKAALLAIDSICTSSKIVYDCMQALDKLHKKAKVTIHWTKAHVGHIGNERADQLAKAGTQKISYQVEPILPVPRSWIKKKISQYIHQEWTTRWQSINEARQTKIFFPQPKPKIAKKLLTYDKQTCAKLFRWISGHSFHRYHNNLTSPNNFDNPSCRICGHEKEETSHLFAYCPGLAQLRMKICGQTTLSDPLKWTPGQLLKLIYEIDKICPEEGMVDNRQIDTGQTADTNGHE
jgi:ribonuclease HI